MELTKSTMQECVTKNDGVLHLDEVYLYFNDIKCDYGSELSFKGSVRGVLESHPEIFCNVKKYSGIYALKKYSFLQPVAAYLMETGKDKYQTTSLCKHIINQ